MNPDKAAALEAEIQSLRLDRQNLTVAVEAAGLGLWGAALDGRDGWSTMENRVLHGLTPEQRLHDPGLLTFLGRLLPEDRGRVEHAIEQTRLHDVPYEAEYRVELPGGGVRWIASWGRVLPGEAGRPKRICGASMDVTARKTAEEERRALELQVRHSLKLESLEVLAGGIAHDFNNLLMTLQGNADLALQDIPRESPARHSLEEIQKASRRASDLTRQLRAYAGTRFPATRLDLSAVVAGMSHLLGVPLSRNVIMVKNLPEGLPAIEAGEAQIRQAAMNLVINAAEAIGVDRPGRIVIETGVKDCSTAYLLQSSVPEKCPAGTYVYLEVSDDGCGMDEETRSRLFDPFYTTKFIGRGLGLAAVLGIVRGHRGAILVESEKGRGAAFRLLFPAAGAAGATAGGPA